MAANTARMTSADRVPIRTDLVHADFLLTSWKMVAIKGIGSGICPGAFSRCMAAHRHTSYAPPPHRGLCTRRRQDAEATDHPAATTSVVGASAGMILAGLGIASAGRGVLSIAGAIMALAGIPIAGLATWVILEGGRVDHRIRAAHALLFVALTCSALAIAGVILFVPGNRVVRTASPMLRPPSRQAQQPAVGTDPSFGTRRLR